MKKILLYLLLACSISTFAQAEFPEGIQLGGNASTVNSTKLLNQNPTTGTLDHINATSLPVSTATQTALNLKANLASPAFTGTVSGITKSMVGLGNVDNTSDLSKPISTATQTALNLKANLSQLHNPVTIGTANGLSLSTQQLSLGLASSGVTGALSGTDWSTFNGKFNTPTGLTTNYLPKWNGSGFWNSLIQEIGTNAGFNVTPTDGLATQNFEMVNGSVISSRTAVPQLYISSNAVGQSYSPVRKVDGYATQYVTQGFDGAHTWSTAPSGLAGSSIAFSPKMKLLNRGVLVINGNDDLVSNNYLQVNGNITASPAVLPNQVPTLGQVQAIAGRPYKVYTALISQSGTNAPTATVLENTLGGTVVWSYLGSGIYKATLAGVFVLDKTISFITFGNVDNPSLNTADVNYTNNNEVTLITRLNGTATNSIMDGRTALEIRVYN